MILAVNQIWARGAPSLRLFPVARIGNLDRAITKRAVTPSEQSGSEDLHFLRWPTPQSSVPHPFAFSWRKGGTPQIFIRVQANITVLRNQMHRKAVPRPFRQPGNGTKAPEGASFQRGETSIIVRVSAFLSSLRCSCPSSTTIIVSTVSWIGLRWQCRPVRKSCEPVGTGRGALPASSSIALAGC